MHIWVDADACPADAKEVLYKTSKRLQIEMTLVANQMMFVPKSNLIHFELVGPVRTSLIRGLWNF